MPEKNSTLAALKYFHHRFYAGRPQRMAELEEVRASAEVARKVYGLRIKAKPPRKELASRVGTTPSVVSRPENDDYEGRSLAMLRRIALALNKQIELRIVSLESTRAA